MSEYRGVPLSERTLESVVIDQCEDELTTTDRISYNLRGDGIVRRWTKNDNIPMDNSFNFAIENTQQLSEEAYNFESLSEVLDYLNSLLDAPEQAETALGYQNQPATLGEIIRLKQLLFGEA